jgi:transposase
MQTCQVAHVDETRWRQGSKSAWLWVAMASWVTVFVVRLSRSGQVARELLVETFAGILVTDRYSAYNWYPVRWRQLCWAHLLRDFEAMRDRGGGPQRRLGRPCWRRRARCLRGGTACATVRSDGQRFALT